MENNFTVHADVIYQNKSVMMSSIFWDITPCSPFKVNRRLGRTSSSYLLYTRFLLGLFYDPEDGGNMLLRNVCRLSTEYAALYPRRSKSL
jgi:hypothetical protein